MFNKEKRQEKRERQKAAQEELKEQLTPRPTYATRMEKKERQEKRDAKIEQREGMVAARLAELHTGSAAGDVVQLGSDLLYVPALSGLQVQVQDQMSSKDKCYTRWMVYGRHDKEFLGMEPTNRDVSFGGVSISFLSDDGKVSQEIHYWDMVALLQQIQAP